MARIRDNSDAIYRAVTDRVNLRHGNLRGEQLSPPNTIGGFGVDTGWLGVVRATALNLADADYVIYSYATPIAWHTHYGLWVVPDVKYSVTTTRHQSLVRDAIHGAGHDPMMAGPKAGTHWGAEWWKPSAPGWAARRQAERDRWMAEWEARVAAPSAPSGATVDDGDPGPDTPPADADERLAARRHAIAASIVAQSHTDLAADALARIDAALGSLADDADGCTGLNDNGDACGLIDPLTGDAGYCPAHADGCGGCTSDCDPALTCVRVVA